jgi:serine protease inhibitor
MQHLGAWRTLSALAVAVAVAGCGTVTPSPSPSPTPIPSASASPSSSPAPTPVADGSTWVPAGTLLAGRASTHAVALDDGRVLVVGSDNICTPGGAWDESAAAEVFDPATGSWSATESLNAPRDGFVAVALPDGRVLITGGMTSGDPAVGPFGAYTSTKLYDPRTGAWSATGLMEVARYAPVAALLHDGRVLVAGGTYIDDAKQKNLASAEIYDPETGEWTMTGDLTAPRSGAQVATLADGRVLVVGGMTPSYGDAPTIETEIYDPASGTWSGAGSLAYAREGFGLVALSDGGALVVGGTDVRGTSTTVVERFNGRGAWFQVAAMTVAVANPTPVLLGDGRVLVAGGLTGPDFTVGSVAIAEAEIYDPATNTWTVTTPLPEPRERAVAVTLADGSILLVGGDRGYVGEPSTPWCPEPIRAAVCYIPANLASFPEPTPRPAPVGVAMSNVPRAAASPAEATTAATAINAFGVELYRRMLADGTLDPAKGAVLSPTSIALALAMARAGARGETAAQMDTVMRSIGADALAEAMNALDRALASRSGRFDVYGGESAGEVLLKLANAPFAQEGMPLEQDYLDALASRFAAGVRLVDYRNDPDGAREVVNGWVKKQTAGRIPDLLAEPDVTTLTRLVLVNAMYLKAPWLNPFDAAATTPGRFTREDGSRVTVPMMNLVRCQGIGICSLPYAAGAGWRAVELPYLGDSLAMTIIVPDDLAAFERGLTAQKLTRITGALRTEPPGTTDVVYDVKVTMPRFGIESRADLAETLIAMGMPLAFDVATADFSGISPIAHETGLYIRKVIHQANIDVDEKGTEAAAATAVVMATGGGPGSREIAFKVDRPFLFLVRDVPTGAILFIGRVTDPSVR